MTTPPPAGGAPGAGAGPSAPADAAGAAGAAAHSAEDKRVTGNLGGASYSDAPVRRAHAPRAVLHRGGPLATFPGFEQLPDGGTRLFVQLNQAVPVEEQRAQGSVTYVLKGAHLRVHNDGNALVTIHFNTPVTRARLVPKGSDLAFVIELRSAVAPAHRVVTNPDKTSTLQIDFPKGTFLTGEPLETAAPREARPGRARAKGLKGARAPKKGAAPPPSEPPPQDDDAKPSP